VRINRALKKSFGEMGNLYDLARPDYPKKLVDDVLMISRIPPRGKILDAGCGTGKATLSFAKRGYSTTGLDISRNLISIAEEKSKKLSYTKYIIGSFEKTAFPDSYFDLIISGQAFHWFIPDISYKKAYKILKNDGHLAIFSNRQDYKENLFLKEVKKLYLKYCSDYNEGTTAKSPREIENYINSTKLFEQIQTRLYLRKLEYSKKKYIKLLNSFSWVYSLEEEAKGKFFMEFSDLLKKEKEPLHIPYKTVLVITKKK
jgi:ubiquinone/menaquinone biosynthesis C-methylase UbiE